MRRGESGQSRPRRGGPPGRWLRVPGCGVRDGTERHPLRDRHQRPPGTRVSTSRWILSPLPSDVCHDCCEFSDLEATLLSFQGRPEPAEGGGGREEGGGRREGGTWRGEEEREGGKGTNCVGLSPPHCKILAPWVPAPSPGAKRSGS